MKTCRGCGGEYRQGTRVALILNSGAIEGAHVCPKCVRRSVHLVSQLVPPVVQHVEQRSDDLAAAIRTLTTFVRATKPYDSDPFTQGRVAGLESALETLRSISQGNRGAA